MDDLAIENVGYYFLDMNNDLLLLCLELGNQFLIDALQMEAFDKNFFKDESLVNQILTLLNEGVRTILVLNLLNMIDLKTWRTKQLKRLIEVFESYTKESFDTNKLLNVNNPLMTIALACELLKKVSVIRKRLENDAMRV